MPDARDRDGLYSLMTAGVVRWVPVLQVGAADSSSPMDAVATEEPLQVLVGGEPFAVIMRTPGADRELSIGFLLAERVITSAADVQDIRRASGQPNVVDVTVTDEATARLQDIHRTRRLVTTNSSCGLCGRVTIESLQVEAPPIRADWVVPCALVRQLPDTVRLAQAVFEQTGGLHAAGLFGRDGRLELLAEDVGRHNAVDKVIGQMVLGGRLPLEDSILFCSGRTSFEIVQKAFLAGIPLVAAVSAPSSLAIELASEAGITLLGFVRGPRFNVYSHRWRVNLD
jgi:FdhD protein